MQMLMRVAAFLLVWVVATPALAKNKVGTIPRVGIGTETELSGLWTYGRLDIIELYGTSQEREQLAPLISGVGLDVTTDWDSVTSFGLSSIGGSRVLYASLGGSILWDQSRKQPIDGGATIGLHTMLFSLNHTYTVKGGRITTICATLDPSFWIRLRRNQLQFSQSSPNL